MTGLKEVFLIVLALLGIFLILKGVHISINQAKNINSEIELKVLIGSFKIKSPNTGLVFCFFGVLMEILVYYALM